MKLLQNYRQANNTGVTCGRVVGGGLSTERCIHDFLPGQCGSCKPTPFGINEVVYTTKMGQVFHNWSDCSFLEDGQRFATSKGQDNHPILPTKWSNVYYTLGPCEWCCALHNSRVSELPYCEAFISGTWLRVRHIRERFTDLRQRQHQVYQEEVGMVHFVSQAEIRGPLT